MNYIFLAIAIVIVFLCLASFIPAGPGSGPGCPGMDPQWLGFCEEVKL